jgi:hypothetical protein
MMTATEENKIVENIPGYFIGEVMAEESGKLGCLNLKSKTMITVYVYRCFLEATFH